MSKLTTNPDKGISAIEQAPIAQLLGLRVLSVKPGRATVQLQASARFANPMGTLHGGILCDLADAAMGIAFASGLEEGESFTTLELKINFLKPVWDSLLLATGHVVKAGHSVGLVECDVTDEGGALVARASSTCMILRGDGAERRNPGEAGRT
jgi:uncharacterized protein (TIGR00369 family)